MDQPVQLRPRTPLTAAQELIWTSQRVHPNVPLANMATVVHLDGNIDEQKFLAAVATVVRASDALRTVITEVDGAPYPAVQPDLTSQTAVLAMSVDAFEDWTHRRIATPIDISKSVYDSVLVDHGGSWSWWLDIHHIATDAASSAQIFQAVSAAYEGEWEAPILYAELATTLADNEASPRWQRAKQHWEQSDVDRPPTRFYTPDSGADTRAERVHLEMSARQAGLDRLLEDRFRLLSPDLSLTAALATALAIYIHRLNGSEEVAIGLPIHHRSTREAKTVIGPLVELFPLVVPVAEDDSFAAVHKRVSKAIFTMLGRVEPGTSPRQSFDIVLNVHGATFGSFADVPTTVRWLHPGHIDSHHRLRVQALDYDGDGQLELAFDVNHAVADSAHRQRSMQHFGAVLDAMIRNPDQLVRTVNLTTKDELLLLQPFTQPGIGTPLDSPTPDLIARQLQRRSNEAVLLHGSRSWTAADVDDQIEAIATNLNEAGIGRGSRVGVELGISVEATLLIHGILRAGAAFVPIDPEYPEARREHLRNDSEAALVLTSLDQLDSLDRSAPVERAALSPDDLAYVIYTSGSTGLPKGVPITHRGLSEYLGFAHAAYVGDAPLVMPLYTSLSFDLTITTLFLPWLASGAMTVHPEGGLPALREIVDEGRVTLMKATPSHLELLVRMIDPTHPLRGVIVGGEAFLTDLADRLLVACGSDLNIWNEYGPTEAVVGCMLHLYDASADPGPEVPIGSAAPGVTLHVLDAVGHTVPLGVEGELFIGRPGMTAGYLNRPELNQEKFVPLTDRSGDVLYRTGDRVRMLDADRMVYLGRIDTQIKIGGIRTEPGEIESAALALPGVHRAVAALWKPDPHRTLRHCVRCGISSDVPDITIDGDGICTACHDYDLMAPQAAAWFRTEADLATELAIARGRSTGDYDVLHLLSGGKDSTYALYRLVEMGARVFALTLDNGFISDGAKDNVRRATAALDVDHEFVTVDGMNEIFRDSLKRFSNVCQGCYKTIYTLALRYSEDLGIPSIVTGLSRGQFFETRLVPGMFEANRFDPDAIDRAVDAARRVYHTTPDAVSDALDTSFLADGKVLDRVNFIDFFRYVDVPLSEMYIALESSGTWSKPADTGRSTNCLINSAGIHVHKQEQAHHNYALPYSWDVRLGHKTRAEAMFELDDPMDDNELASIMSMLAEVGYEPSSPEVLTLWIEADEDLDIEELRASLCDQLPAHAVPTAIDVVSEIPLTANGKVDVAALPAPSIRQLDTHVSSGRAVSGPTETVLATIWEHVLGQSGVGAEDDFFALGGTSLHALEMIVRVSDSRNQTVPEALAFRHRTIAELAVAIDRLELGETAGHNAVIPALEGDARPMSAGEEAMLYEWRRDPTDVRYNVARLYSLPAELDRERFDKAVREVVEHQPTLHTSYGASRSVLSVESAVKIRSVQSTTASIEEVANQLNAEVFDLVTGPLMTVHHIASPIAGVPGAVLVRTHHISSDAGSLDVLWDQIDTAYRGESLPDHTVRYAAHGAWQRSQPQDLEAAWPSNQVDGLGELSLRRASAEPDGYVERRAAITATELRAAVGTTPFATTLTALAAALEPFHSDTTFEIAVTSSVRDHPDLHTVVGYFLNPLPLLLSIDRTATGRELADQVSERLADSLVHRSIPFPLLVQSARERGVTAPASRVMLAVEDLAPAELDGVPIEHTILASGTAVNDLTFFVQLRNEQVDIGCEYRGESVSRTQTQMLLDLFSEALESLVRNPESTVVPISVIPEPLAGAPIARPIIPASTRLDATIEMTPGANAATCGGQTLTYGALDERARLIAARLRAVGVSAGDRVAVVVPRSVDLVVAIRAAWLLGASYVPIDVSQPAARVAALVAAANATAALSSGDGHPGLGEVTTVRIDQPDDAVLPMTGEYDIDGDDEAYLIFTSGSTGQPKGVPVRHDNLAHSLAARLDFYEQPVNKFLLLSSAGFDSSVAGLFWTLADGGELIIPTEDEIHDIDAVLRLIERHQPTHTLCVPGLYGGLLQRNGGALPSLQTVIVAGEACPAELVQRHINAGGGALVNEYGPTEATVWSTAFALTDELDADVPIGGPIPGVVADVQRPNGSRVPIDVAGELVISGPTVVDGYLQEADESSAFTTDASGVRSYRTGDRVVRRTSGVFEYLGRIDEQLSVGGVRIEPAELEHALTSMPGVHAAAVGSRNGQLLAWVEASPPQTGDSLRDALRDRFAPTHVPRAVTIVDALPRNTNGKVDRATLDTLPIDLTESRTSGERLADGQPRRLAQVQEIFVEAFDGQAIAADADFFEMGGDSLRAVVLVSLLEERFDRRVGIGELIDAPTPGALAALLFGLEASTETPSQPRSGLVEWLRRSGTQNPLIVLPPGGGNLLRYAPLVQALDPDTPVVGVRLPGADARSEVIESIAGQARAMLAELDRAGVGGPYRLLGWSTGGLLAWEIAHMLRARGDDVELVALVDTVMGGVHAQPAISPVTKYADMLQSGDWREAATEGFGRLRERTEFSIARRRYRRDRQRGRTPNLQDAERELGPVVRRASLSYHPSALNLPVLYFSASESGVDVTVDPWTRLQAQGGGIAVVTLPGVHFLPEDQCIIGPNRVSSLVEALETHLR